MHRDSDSHHIQVRGPGRAALAIAAAAVLSGSCFFETRTNLCEASGRRCPPGQVCAANQDACIPIGGCGDGIVDAARGEICDDGNIQNNDSCSSDCTSDRLCGNGVVDAEEECDAGVEDSPGCDGDCTFAACGDGHVNAAAGEECDTGDLDVSTSDCNGRFCTRSECGDAVYNPAAAEACDTGGDTQACNGNDATGGPAGCAVPRCGDGYTNRGYTPPGATLPEECDAAGADDEQCNGNNHGGNGPGSCRTPRCGDGYANPRHTPTGATAPEQCDAGEADTPQCNGNNHGAEGPGSCRVPVCGDGYTNRSHIPRHSTLPEQCDAGGANTAQCNGNNQGAEGPGSCRVAACGDGYTNPSHIPKQSTLPEQCDAGGANTAQCNGNNQGVEGPGSCRTPRCGDRYVNPQSRPNYPPSTPIAVRLPESCDAGGNSSGCNGNDGNNDLIPDDGAGSCQPARCGDGYLNPAAGEICDPGGPVDPNDPQSPDLPSVGCTGQQSTCIPAGPQRCKQCF